MKRHSIIFLIGLSLISCRILLNKKISIQGKISITEHKIPVNSKVELFNEAYELISKIDSTFNGNFNFNINNKYFKKKLYLVVSDIKVETEKNDFVPNGLIFCNNIPDTIPLNINNKKLNYKLVSIKNCKPLEMNEFSPHK